MSTAANSARCARARALSALFWIVLAAAVSVAEPVSAQQRPPAQSDDAAITQAQRFIGLLQRAQWDSATALISPTVSGHITLPGLQSVWSQIRTSVGELQGVTLHAVTPVDSVRAVDFIAHFATHRLSLRVMVAASGITGFWLNQPPADATPRAVPPYADTTKFREFDMSVGSDPWKLPATLTLPSAPGPHPVLVLVHGSGPHDRDETVGPNRPFRDLAWGLATQGMAVLRYEKRTKTHGAHMSRGVTIDEEVVDDALAALQQLRTHPAIDATRVFVLGHSLGGMLAPEIAERDGRLAGAILVAAPARDILTVITAQLEYLATLPMNAGDVAQEELRRLLAELGRFRDGRAKESDFIMGAPAPYWSDLLARNPVAVARRIRTPLLVLNGERDYQVPVTELNMWRAALRDRPRTTIQAFPALNHLMMAGTGRPTPAEYHTPGQVAAEVIEAIRAFVFRTAR